MKNKTKDPLIQKINCALDFESFISYSQAWDFICDLEDVKKKIDELSTNNPARAAYLYEVLLAGCYEKADDIDDSDGDLGMFFEDIFSEWVKARQNAGDAPKKIVNDILKWIEHDDYGFCYEIEKKVAVILKKGPLKIFKQHFMDRFEEAYKPFEKVPPKYIFDYPRDVWNNANVLKDIFIEKKDVKSYLDLCQRIVVSPKDCEMIAELYISKKKYDAALEMIEKGIEVTSKRDWRNQSSHSLTDLKKIVLSKSNRKEDALSIAWSEFKESPTEYGYEDVMKYVPKKDKKLWHEKTMTEAGKACISGFIDICVKTKEWDVLAKRVLKANDKDLADLSHFTTTPAAKGLENRNRLASAKLYCNLGLRIVDSKKSKYYRNALEHFKKARDLYVKEKKESMWEQIVEKVNEYHSRKYSFINDFNDLAEGKPRKKTQSEQKKDRILNYSKKRFFK